MIAEMARLLGDAIRHIDNALVHLDRDGDAVTEAADAAIKTERELERAYSEARALNHGTVARST